MNPAEIFAGNEVQITCGPPPSQLNFNTTLSVVWTYNDAFVKEVKPMNRTSTYLVEKFSSLNDGKKYNPYNVAPETFSYYH